MLSGGHEHSFICSLSFNVITVSEKTIKKSALPQHPALSLSIYICVCVEKYMHPKFVPKMPYHPMDAPRNLVNQ